MKKTIFAICGSLLLLAGACNSEYKEKIQLDSVRIAELTTNYQEATNFNDSLMLLMADIYNGLDSINMQEGLLYSVDNGETDRRAEVRKNLSAIKERLAVNHHLLEEMEQKLKASGNQNATLTKTIEQWKVRLAQQEEHIESLESQLAMANDSIEYLNEKVAATEQQVQVQTERGDAAFNLYTETEAKLNTVYYALGTNKELKNNGLLEQKFLSATKVLEGNDINYNYFTSADKRTLTSIDTHSKKVKIWTQKPEDSYQKIENADKTITIKITDPAKFWQTSPYLIIQTD